MRIVIYSMNYHPEQTGIGKYSGEMAVWLRENGYDVRVVCAPPYYPSWTVGTGYSPWKYSVSEQDGIKVYRAPLWVPRRPSGFSRAVHLLSFAISSAPLLFMQVAWRPTIVFTVAPAITCAPGGLFLARLCGAKAWLHVQDFEVDVAFRMGLFRGQLVQKAAGLVERSLLRRFDVVSTISASMLRMLERKQVNSDRCRLLPNWVDISAVSVLKRRSKYRDELGITEDQKVALFSGSLGSKQGLMVIPKAAKLLQDRKDITFVICGDGVMKDEIRSATSGMSNVKLIPLQPYERLSELLGMADFHLLPQSPEAEDLVLPSKLSGMLASGRPIIATCRPNTEIAGIVARCGLVCPPESAPGLAKALIQLADMDPAARSDLGEKARQLAVERLSQDNILNSFCTFISSVGEHPKLKVD